MPQLGYVGGPGSHVRLDSGNVARSTTAHEVGHNFGLQHAQRYYTKSEAVLSDDADQVGMEINSQLWEPLRILLRVAI